EPGNGPADEHQMVVGIDADDLEISHGHPLVAVSAGHADALLRPAATAVGGVRGDRAALAGALLDTVAVPQAAEVVPLDDAGHAAALGPADHVHGLDLAEHVGHGQNLADGVV